MSRSPLSLPSTLLFLPVIVALSACGGAPEEAGQTADEITVQGTELLVPDLAGDFHQVKGRVARIQGGRFSWEATVEGRRYTLEAGAVAGGYDLSVRRQDSPELITLKSRGEDFIVEVSRGGAGEVGITYGGGRATGEEGEIATSDSLAPAAEYFQPLLSDDAGLSAALLVFAMPQALQIAAADAPPASQDAIAALFLTELLSRFIKVIRKAMRGGSGPKCPGGSQAECVDTQGNRSSVSCGDCSARCIQVATFGGTTCSCSCGT